MSSELTEAAKILRLGFLENHHDRFFSTYPAKAKPQIQSAVIDLLQKELSHKKERSMRKRLADSKVGTVKPMSDFDWNWPKKMDKSTVKSLFDLSFIEKKSNIVLLGPEGVGKSMIAKNLALTAANKGYSSLFATASQITTELKTAANLGALLPRLKRYLRAKILVIDELGYLSFDSAGADLLFKVVAERYEKSSIIVTTNLPFSEWNTIFPNATCVTAMIDRLTHHSEILTIEADSYRLHEQKNNRNKKS